MRFIAGGTSDRQMQDAAANEVRLWGGLRQGRETTNKSSSGEKSGNRYPVGRLVLMIMTPLQLQHLLTGNIAPPAGPDMLLFLCNNLNALGKKRCFHSLDPEDAAVALCSHH